MKTVFGLVLIVAGIALGLYVGLWLMFIGGIVQLIDAIRAPQLVAMTIALGVVKIIFAGVSGGISAISLIIPGYRMLRG